MDIEHLSVAARHRGAPAQATECRAAGRHFLACRGPCLPNMLKMPKSATGRD